ncbi:FAD:protein FMN transferase [Akkermansiaceae bacterium]|nr:FAD:protein FMN transferase [Akkermansiaceae bacterium]
MASCGGDKEPPVLTGEAMGTTWKLAWRGDCKADLAAEVPAVLGKWENVLSQWREDSDLSRHNRGEHATPELRRVIALAEEIHDASAGAFDYRMLRETNVAGFGPAGDGMDLSGIGKGFAVDRVGERLRELGVNDFVFELGGEILAGDGEWEVAIEAPDPASRKALRTVKLNNRALATSGNYRQFQPAPGGLAGHILDPRNRKPLVRPPSSVTVIAADCATADAWATALFVLGREIADPPSLEVQWNEPD